MEDAGKKLSLLIIDDQADIRLSIAALLRREFPLIENLDHPARSQGVIEKFHPDVILLDMNFSRGMSSGNEGITWLKKIRDCYPQIPVVMMTAYGDVDLAVRAVKLGAFDFVLKPWDNERFLTTMKEAGQLSRSRSKADNSSVSADPIIIGNSESIVRVLTMAEKVSKTDANILLLGENGTGKDLLASFIHNRSKRSGRPMIKIDLGSIPDSLFESELFGYRKGAFTDAREDKAGWIEVANHSTLFMDEIGNASSGAQSKLLNVIQSGKVARLGGVATNEVDVRLICATNRDPKEMISNGSFRRDLLFRINTVEIVIPPLRERGDDVDLLANHFLNLFCEKYNREMVFSEKCVSVMRKYQWPGNIRELEHSVERAVILCDQSEIHPQDMVIAESDREDVLANGLMNLEEMERKTIHSALSRHNGKVTHAARDLGLTRASLYRRMDKYGL